MNEWLVIGGDFALGLAKIMVPMIVGLIGFYVRKRYNIKIEAGHEALLKSFLRQGVNFAEQKWKRGTADRSNDDRLQEAVKHTISLIENSGLPKAILKRGDRRLRKLIEAELGQANHEKTIHSRWRN